MNELERDGWFVTVRRRSFELVSHFSSVEDWQAHDWWEGYDTHVPEELDVAARRRLTAGDGEFVVREQVRASLLEPIPNPDSDPRGGQ